MWAKEVLTVLGLAALMVALGTDESARAAAPPPERRAAAPGRPNILFIFSDDHAAQAVSAYGSKINQTPHIDRLAREGMLFRNAFVTNSICCPSRATILTGQFSHLNGVFNIGDRFDGSQQTFPKLLQKAGYQTAVIGKWHLFSDPTGFDHWSVLTAAGQQGTYYNPAMLENGRPVQHTGYTTDIVTDLAIEWLKAQRDQGKPFMLMVQHKAPHRSWEPGPDHLTRYDERDIPEPPTLFDDYAGRTDAARTQEMTIARHMYDFDLKLVPPGNLTPEQRKRWDEAYEPKNQAMRAAKLTGKERTRWNYQRYLKDYLRCIDSVDDNVGRLLKHLDESGLGDNTIVIYNSDQGFYLGEHGWYDKRFMYEESLRAPLIVRWPGVVKPGSEDQHLVQNLDFAQTFLEFAGVDAPPSMQGRSLVPFMMGDSPPDWRRSIYYHYYDWPAVHMVREHYGVRTDRYKLIHFYSLDQWELFDLQRDPREMKSVYDDPTYADVVREMKAELKRLQAHHKDDHPTLPIQLVTRPELIAQAGKVKLQKIFQLDRPREQQPPAADPSAKPFAVGAHCVPQAQDGVLIAHGGDQFGYSLFIFKGRPYFTVRNRGRYLEAISAEPVAMNQPLHLAGQLTAKGQLQLFVNGERAASVPGHFIEQAPVEGLSIGEDAGTFVGGYGSPLAFEGELSAMRLYFGELDDATLSDWARPAKP